MNLVCGDFWGFIAETTEATAVFVIAIVFGDKKTNGKAWLMFWCCVVAIPCDNGLVAWSTLVRCEDSSVGILVDSTNSVLWRHRDRHGSS
jgi:hypothetical protein